MKTRLLRIAAIGLLSSLAATGAAARPAPGSTPVAQVAPMRVAVPAAGAASGGELPLYANVDWSRPQPDATRVVLVMHGVDRNASTYFATARDALALAGDDARHTVLLVPQFLTEADAQAHDIGPEVLRWHGARWEGGLPAEAPVAVSSFAALDAILARLADASAFPALRQVVIAGHSGGGQIVQRYAVVGNGVGALEARGIAVRYVVANPSSYVWFSPERPEPTGACGDADRWKYGFEGNVPPYVTQDAAALEKRYVQRDVTYLLGGADTDPHHPALDVSCAGEAQGPYRYVRGLNYFHMLQARDGDRLKHRVLTVDGVGHDERRMFTSACGLAALFDRPGCVAH